MKGLDYPVLWQKYPECNIPEEIEFAVMLHEGQTLRVTGYYCKYEVSIPHESKLLVIKRDGVDKNFIVPATSRDYFEWKKMICTKLPF